MSVEKRSTVQQQMVNVTNKMLNLSKVENNNHRWDNNAFFARDFGMSEWDWPQGLGLFGIARSNQTIFSSYIEKWAKQRIEEGLPSKNINTIMPLFTLADNHEFDSLTLSWMKEIETKFCRTKNGLLQHDTTGNTRDEIHHYKNQIWVDSIFMTVLFMAKMAKNYRNDIWLSDANYQVLGHIKYLQDCKSGLFYHGWDDFKKSNMGNIFWCRGNGWMTYGLPLYLQLTNGSKYMSSINHFVEESFRRQCDTLLKLKNPHGIWHTVLDDDSSYEETSGSAAIIAGMYLGMSLGILEKNVYESKVDDAFKQLLSRICTDGTVTGVSTGTAISKDINDYKKIEQSPMAYGQSLVLCAISEYLLERGESFV